MGVCNICNGRGRISYEKLFTEGVRICPTCNGTGWQYSGYDSDESIQRLKNKIINLEERIAKLELINTQKP